MRIAEVKPLADWKLHISADDGRVGQFDLRPYLQFEAFSDLQDVSEFCKVRNGGYFIEWECGADLSADTKEAKMRIAA